MDQHAEQAYEQKLGKKCLTLAQVLYIQHEINNKKQRFWHVLREGTEKGEEQILEFHEIEQTMKRLEMLDATLTDQVKRVVKQYGKEMEDRQQGQYEAKQNDQQAGRESLAEASPEPEAQGPTLQGEKEVRELQEELKAVWELLQKQKERERLLMKDRLQTQQAMRQILLKLDSMRSSCQSHKDIDQQGRELIQEIEKLEQSCKEEIERLEQEIKLPSDQETVRISIKTLEGKIFIFDVKLDDTIESVMHRVQCKIGIPVGLQRLIFNGEALRRDHVLSDYGIQNGSTVYAVSGLQRLQNKRRY